MAYRRMSSLNRMYQDSLEQDEPGETSVDDKMLRSVTTEAQIPAEEEGFYSMYEESLEQTELGETSVVEELLSSFTLKTRTPAEEEGSNSEAKPVTIVAFESGYPKMDTDALADVLEDVKQLPLIIISMIGTTRGGKSFLLNLYINYLNYLEKNGEDRNWESSKTQTSGFPWGMSEDPITKGISVWSKPFIIKSRKGEQMAVLLMDCEGENDTSGSTNVDNLVTFISLQISSVQLINVEKQIGLSDLKRLNLCLKNVAIFQDDESLDEESLFKSLVFVARNYNQGELCGEDSRVFDKLQKNPQENSVAIIEGIKSSFKVITRFKFSYPGSTIDGATAETYDWNLRDINKTFLDPAKSLFRRISFMDDQYESQDCWETAADAVLAFETIQDMFKNKGALTQTAYLKDSICRKIYMKTLKKCEVAMLRFLEKLESFMELEDLEKALEREAEHYKKKFLFEIQDHGVLDLTIWSKYELELKKTIGDIHLMVVVEQKKMRLARLRKELQAANEGSLEQLLRRQKVTIEGWIKNSETSFKDADLKDSKSIEELEEKLAEAPNWRTGKRIRKQLDAASERLRKRKVHYDCDVARLRNYIEAVETRTQMFRGDATAYTRELKKEFESLTPEIKKRVVDIKDRLNSESNVKAQQLMATAALVIGLTPGPPSVKIAAVAAYGFYELAKSYSN